MRKYLTMILFVNWSLSLAAAEDAAQTKSALAAEYLSRSQALNDCAGNRKVLTDCFYAKLDLLNKGLWCEEDAVSCSNSGEMKATCVGQKISLNPDQKARVEANERALYASTVSTCKWIQDVKNPSLDDDITVGLEAIK